MESLGLGVFTEESVIKVTRPPAGELPETQKKGDEGEVAPSPFIVSESLYPKLVSKIWGLEYVDMSEILRDNVELERRQIGEPSSSNALRLSRREVPDLLSWVVCYGMFASALSAKFPEKTRQLWAYLIREARRCGGKGWQAYDSMFRQPVAKNQSVLNTSLYATSFLAQANGRGRLCIHCMETDHASAACALAPLSKTPLPRKESMKEDQKPRQRGGVPGGCWA